MTITTLCGLKGRENVLLSGGYDRVVRAWDLTSFKKIGQLDLGVCINYMCSGAPDSPEAYVGSSEGWIGKIEFVGTNQPPTQKPK